MRLCRALSGFTCPSLIPRLRSWSVTATCMPPPLKTWRKCAGTCRARRQQRRVLLTTGVAGAQGTKGRFPRPNQGRLPRKPRALPCSVGKATKANVESCPLLGLAQVVARLDPSRLVPYDKGDPAGIVRRIDAAMGLRPKPL